MSQIPYNALSHYVAYAIVGILAIVGCKASQPQAETRDRSRALNPPDYAGDTLDQWLNWSEPDNGIVARIEYLIPPRSRVGGALYLRIQNIGDEPATVFDGGVDGITWTHCFELYRWHEGEWRAVFWPAYRFRSELAEQDTTQLQPGQSLLIHLKAPLPKELMASRYFKVGLRLPGVHVLRIMDPKDGRSFVPDADRKWEADPRLTAISIDTPPFPTHFTKQMNRKRMGLVPAPTFWPFQDGGRYNLEELKSQTDGRPDNGSGNVVLLSDLHYGQYEAIQMLALYRPEVVREQMERLLDEPDRDPHWRLMIAMLAAREGSEKGRAIIAETIKHSEGEILRSSLYAVDFLLRHDGPRPWAEKIAIAAIEDPRGTGEKDAYGQELPVAYLAINGQCNVLYALGLRKCTDAVPALIRRVQSNHWWSKDSCIIALGNIGDPQATPVLMSVLKQELQDKRWDSETGKPAVLQALTQLKAREAVPLLIDNIEKYGVPQALGYIGDKSAIPSLHKLAESGRFDAKVALYRLGDPSVADELLSIATDYDRSEFQRSDAVHVLNEPPNPTAIPLLVSVAENDPSGMVIISAIRELAEHQSAEGIKALIRCFDADYSNRHGWKVAYNPEHYRDIIADALYQLTGQTFGDNPDAWRKWWMTTGERQFVK